MHGDHKPMTYFLWLYLRIVFFRNKYTSFNIFHCLSAKENAHNKHFFLIDSSKQAPSFRATWMWLWAVWTILIFLWCTGFVEMPATRGYAFKNVQSLPMTTAEFAPRDIRWQPSVPRRQFAISQVRKELPKSVSWKKKFSYTPSDDSSSSTPLLASSKLKLQMDVSALSSATDIFFGSIVSSSPTTV